MELEVLAIAQDLGQVAGETTSGYILLGYDDLYAIQYFGENRRPYWNRKGDKTIEGELNAAATEYAGIMDRCADFDVQLMNKAAAVGGKKYAELCALAYRQAIAAHKLIEDKEGNLIFLSKENFSNGSNRYRRYFLSFCAFVFGLQYRSGERIDESIFSITVRAENGRSLLRLMISVLILWLTARPMAGICRLKRAVIC